MQRLTSIHRFTQANQERELELRYELDRLRQAKMDAELRAEGFSRQVCVCVHYDSYGVDPS
jgi:hypothetical protein